MLPSAPLVMMMVSGGAGCTKCSVIHTATMTSRTNGPSVSARSRHEIWEILRRGMSGLRILAALEVGSPTRARTWDLRINSPSLYQLSYRGSERKVAILTETPRSPQRCCGSRPPYQGANGRLRDHFRDRFGDVFDVAGIQRGDADAAGLDGVDGVLLAQALHLVLGEARVGEHAALLEDEAPVHLGALLDVCGELEAHALDAVAHGAELLFPLGAQLG